MIKKPCKDAVHQYSQHGSNPKVFANVHGAKTTISATELNSFLTNLALPKGLGKSLGQRFGQIRQD